MVSVPPPALFPQVVSLANLLRQLALGGPTSQLLMLKVLGHLCVPE
jgi:hypothetical protein